MRTPLPSLLAVAALLSVACGPALGAPETPSADRAYVDAVLDGLIDLGILNAQQVEAIKAKGQQAATAALAQIKAKPAETPARKGWWESLKISGYVQGRWQYCPDEDGEPDNEFLIRRGRVTLEAKPNAETTVVFQPDFGNGDLSVMDAWVQRAWGEDGTSRLRLGQQVLPFGFEMNQSTALLLPLERSWVVSGNFPGIRDTGITYYYTDPGSRRLLNDAKSAHGGTGDWGNIAMGIYNGQSLGLPEMNDGKHIAARVTWPMMLDLGGDGEKDQYVELGASYWNGSYRSAAGMDFDDELLGIHGFVAPQPLGLQAEYYTGETLGHDLDGFYAMGIYDVPSCDGTVFVRYDEVEGFRKGRDVEYSRDRWSIGYAHELDSKNRVTVEYDIQDLAGGVGDDQFGVQWMVRY